MVWSFFFVDEQRMYPLKRGNMALLRHIQGVANEIGGLRCLRATPAAPYDLAPTYHTSL